MAKMTEKQVIAHEHELAEAAKLRSEDPYAAICRDRLKRWKEAMKAVTVPEPLKGWAADMEIMHGTSQVKAWVNTVDWLTALMIARYGEAECHWPAAFAEGDIQRANRWLAGNVPEGITYIVAREG